VEDEHKEGMWIELDRRERRIGDGTGVSMGAGEVAQCGGVAHARMASRAARAAAGVFRVTCRVSG
jgi:hypothetical protein